MKDKKVNEDQNLENKENKERFSFSKFFKRLKVSHLIFLGVLFTSVVTAIGFSNYIIIASNKGGTSINTSTGDVVDKSSYFSLNTKKGDNSSGIYNIRYYDSYGLLGEDGSYGSSCYMIYYLKFNFKSYFNKFTSVSTINVSFALDSNYTNDLFLSNINTTSSSVNYTSGTSDSSDSYTSATGETSLTWSDSKKVTTFSVTKKNLSSIPLYRYFEFKLVFDFSSLSSLSTVYTELASSNLFNLTISIEDN